MSFFSNLDMRCNSRSQIRKLIKVNFQDLGSFTFKFQEPEILGDKMTLKWVILATFGVRGNSANFWPFKDQKLRFIYGSSR